MNRAVIAVATTLAAIACGCSQTDFPPPDAKPITKSSADAAKTAGASAPGNASTAKPPSAKEYYEVNRNGKTYVFGKLDSVLAFRKSGATPPGVVEKPAFGPAGETVVFETGDGVEAGLMADYAKAHPKK